MAGGGIREGDDSIVAGADGSTDVALMEEGSETFECLKRVRDVSQSVTTTLSTMLLGLQGLNQPETEPKDVKQVIVTATSSSIGTTGPMGDDDGHTTSSVTDADLGKERGKRKRVDDNDRIKKSRGNGTRQRPTPDSSSTSSSCSSRPPSVSTPSTIKEESKPEVVEEKPPHVSVPPSTPPAASSSNQDKSRKSRKRGRQLPLQVVVGVSRGHSVKYDLNYALTFPHMSLSLMALYRPHPSLV